MIELLVMAFRTLLPFLKESLLSGSTFREWMKRNKTACVWLGFILLMLLAVMYLATTMFRQAALLHHAQTQLATLSVDNERLKGERQKAVDDLAALTLVHEDFKGQHTTLLGEAAELEEKVEKYETWLRNCGINTDFQGTGFPQCPVKRVVVRQRARAAPTPAPTVVLPQLPAEEGKLTFRERFRALFTGSAKKEEEK